MPAVPLAAGRADVHGPMRRASTEKASDDHSD